MRGKAICPECDTDFTEMDDSAEGFANFYTFSMGGGHRGDLHIECPECGGMIEAEIKVITFDRG